MNLKLFATFIFYFLLIQCSFAQGDWIACGDDKVMIIDSKTAINGKAKVVWTWKVSEATEIPAGYQKLMIPLDECKPVEGGKQLLITSSGGGALLLDKATKKYYFMQRYPWRIQQICCLIIVS
ncbi:hypothetical protein [Niabella ginsengisoli]|uniref:Ricin B lectin domain-containing protein n=1 Tax=Niabella ginsengisoli TaxID=522298 RepID=A0ABS9SQT7_9BACT|nr:hypothetical protein [Niabella ginsengisoli]MCH5600745.1 hypothetical protein [Niabella ginsengisoli]